MEKTLQVGGGGSGIEAYLMTEYIENNASSANQQNFIFGLVLAEI